MTGSTAIQFGAGNIGRGFIGVLLWQAGYQVIFVDVVEPLLDLINRHRQYTVTEVDPSGDRQITVENVKALNAQAEADIIVLPNIAPVLAKGLRRRADLKLGTPLNIIACENLIGNSKILHDHVLSHLPMDYHTYVEHWSGFPCCVVDKVVPPVAEAEREDNPLLVVTEGHGLLIVDRAGFRGDPPAIDGLKLTDNLNAYVEQKIFTLNTGHAIIAYLGYLKGYEFIHQALGNSEIGPVVSGAMAECNQMLTKRHNIDPADQEQYTASTLERFKNAALPDPVVRVAREPGRKLAPNDRLVKPALLALEAKVTPYNLATGIAAALLYDYANDEQATKLSKSLKQAGLDKVLDEVCGLSSDSVLAQLVKEKFLELKKLD
jgi:mannitol-1-phosphate 5-dehydrogenase